MLSTAEVDRIVNGAALAALRNRDLKKVYSEPTLDADGREAIHVLIVLNDASPDKIDGDAALDVIVTIQRQLNKAGESRFAFVDFATEAELKQDGGN